MYIVSGLLKEALLSAGLHELQILRKATQSSVMHITLASQQQHSTQILLQYAEELIRNNGRITNIKIATELSIFKGTVETLLIPWDIQKWVLAGLREA